MHKFFLSAIIFFSLVFLELSAQQNSADLSIRDSLFSARPHETQVQKAIIYLELADILKDNFPQKSFSYITSAFRIATLEKNDLLKATARIRLGDYYLDKREFLHAHEQYLAAWNIYRLNNNITGEVETLLKIGIINRSLKNYDKALEYLQKGLTLVRKPNIHLAMGRLDEQIGITYQTMGDNETAQYFFNKALSLYHQAGDRKREFQVKNNLGTVYLDENRNDDGLKFYNDLLKEADKSDTELIGIIYTRIGHIYDKKGDFRSSLKCNLKALEIRQQARLTVEVNSSLINIAGDYYHLGKPDSGKIYMDSGLLIARRFDRKAYIENGNRHLYTYYLRKGNYKQALDYYARYSAVHEELIQECNRNNIAILETNQQLQRIQQSGKMFARQRDIQNLNLKNQDYQRDVLKVLIGLAGASMLIGVFLLLYIRRDRKKMQELNVQLLEEIREREATEEQTRNCETQYKFITDNSIDFITHIDQHNNRIYASPASLKVYGYEPEEIMLKSSYDLTCPDDFEYEETQFREMIESRSSRQFTFKAQKKDGTVFWVESILNPLFDPFNGIYKGMVGVIRDIQDRKTKEFEIMEGTKQKENLLKEIHHRVKNNFAILVSLINMQMTQTKNKELLQSLTNLQLRIRTMSLVHEMLYRSNDFEKISFPGYLRSLASVIAGTYNRRDVELTIEADEVVMDIEASIPIGLIVNEILSNSYKHAFPEGRAGKISVRFTVDKQRGVYILKIKDDGIGMPDGVKLDQFTTMGLQVVQILCAQIEAELVVANEAGAAFIITFAASKK